MAVFSSLFTTDGTLHSKSLPLYRVTGSGAGVGFA